MDIINILESEPKFIYNKKTVLYNPDLPQTCHITLKIVDGMYDMYVACNGRQVPEKLNLYGNIIEFDKIVNIYNKQMTNVTAVLVERSIKTPFRIVLHNCTIENYDPDKHIVKNSVILPRK